MKPLPQEGLSPPGEAIVFAHRGGSGLWPENTMLAFEEAVALGVDALELDIHRTADNELVVIHDPTVHRTTDGHGVVISYTLSALKELDAGYWWTNDNGRTYPFRGQGITIPTLREVFEAFPDMWINIDIKQHDLATVEAFAQLVQAYGREKYVLAGSFGVTAVSHFRQKLPQAATAASRREVLMLFILSNLGLSRFYRSHSAALQIPSRSGYFPLATSRFVKAAHRKGTAVHVWTINEEEEMERLLHMGVDGIMTDYPDKLLALLGRV